MLPGTVKELLEDAAKRTSGNHVVIPIRKLISYWGAKRRGYWIVDQIERELDQYKLATYPPFNVGWIDGDVELVPVKDPQKESSRISDYSSPKAAEGANRAPPQASLKVGTLSSANMGVISVKMDDNLETVQTLIRPPPGAPARSPGRSPAGNTGTCPGSRHHGRSPRRTPRRTPPRMYVAAHPASRHTQPVGTRAVLPALIDDRLPDVEEHRLDPRHTAS